MSKRNGAFPQRRRRVRRKDHSQFLQAPQGQLFDEVAPGAGLLKNYACVPIQAVQSGNVSSVIGGSQDVTMGSSNFGSNTRSIEDMRMDAEDNGGVLLMPDDEYAIEGASEHSPQGGNDGGSGGTGESNQRTRIPKAQDAFRLLSEGRTLEGVFSVIGSRRYAVWQYNTMRRRFNHRLKDVEPIAYPSYSKIQQSVFPLLRSRIYVPSTTLTLEVDSSKAGAPGPVLGENGELVPSVWDIRLVTISSWGRNDLSRGNVGATGTQPLVDSQGRGCEKELFDSIEDAAMCRMRISATSASLLCTTELCNGFEIPTLHYHNGCVVDVWLSPREPLRTMAALLSKVGSGNRHFLMRAVTCRSTYLVTEATSLLDPGDVAVELECNDRGRLPPQSGSEVKLLLVHQMMKMDGKPRIHLVLQGRRAGTEYVERARCTQLRVSSPAGRAAPAAVPITSCCNRGLSPKEESGGRSGILQDGRPYVVYRCIIYADNFDPFVGRKGSAGGCYLMPVGIPYRDRTGVKGIKVLSMTPPGITTGKVIKELIPDLVKGTVTGFEIRGRHGEPVQMFIDVIGYQCDYFAVGEESDLKGHNGVSPCNLCTFERGDRRGRQNSMYAYTTSIHSANMAFRRNAVRMEAMRGQCKNEDDLQLIGLNDISEEERHRLPLHAIHTALLQARDRVPLTIDGVPVVSAAFDPYLSAIIAPDHLFGNLIKDVVNTNIKSLSKKDGQRSCMHELLRQALKSNGLLTEAQYVDEDKGKLHGMSMATLFKVILVAPWAIVVARSLDEQGRLDTERDQAEDVVTLAFKLKDLFVNTMLYGREYRDGGTVAREFTPDGWRHRERAFTKQAMEYISSLDKCCGKCEDHAELLDKPNVHRLLELYVHTIPTFGHVRQYEELSLERTHQPLKRVLSNSNFRSAQLQVMDHVLGDDWKGKLKTAVAGATTSESLDDRCLANLGRAMIGGDLPSDNRDANMDQLRNVFDTALVQELNEFSSFQCEAVRERTQGRKWVGSGTYTSHSESDSFRQIGSDARAALLSHVQNSVTAQNARISSVSRACRIIEHNDRRTSSHKESYEDNIKSGDIVQAVVTKPGNTISAHGEGITIEILPPAFSSSGDMRDAVRTAPDEVLSTASFWFVIGVVETQPPLIIGDNNIEVCAVVLPMIPTGPEGNVLQPVSAMSNCYEASSLPVVYTTEGPHSRSAYILPLTHGVMKVMRLHACRRVCTFDTVTRKLLHKTTDDATDRWVLYGSVQGYPPRSG